MIAQRTNAGSTLVLAVVAIGAAVIGAVTLAADDTSHTQNAVPEKALILADLMPPPAPGSFAVAEHDTVQSDTGPVVTASDCVGRLDAHFEGMFITFDLGEAQISAQNAPLLSHIADLITACPDALVMVAGHAGGSGDDQRNLALSWDRADETLEILVGLGVDPAALEAVGYGARAPLAQGSDDADASDRRVDFRVLRRRD